MPVGLNKTEGWVWEIQDPFYENLENWIKIYSLIKRFPSSYSNNIEEKKASIWQSNQRKNYKNKTLSEEKIKILNSTEGWKWEENSWEEQLAKWSYCYNKHGKKPSSTSKDQDEKAAGIWQIRQRILYREKQISKERIEILNNIEGWEWEEKDTFYESLDNWIRYKNNRSNEEEKKKATQWQSDMRKYYKKKNKRITEERIKILESTPGWQWSEDQPPNTPFVAAEREQNTIVYPSQPRTRKPIKPIVNPGSGHKHNPSKLEEFHKRFKSMNASTYKDQITKEEFTEYHAIADSYDEKDPIERQPIHKITCLLSKYNKPSYAAIDLGCGMNRLRSIESVSKMKWTSVDVFAVDSSVTIANMAELPYDDESFDFTILGRSLWARNHMAVLEEVYRILKSGGRAIICESFRRWLNDNQENTLITDLKKIGFEIVFEEGTSSDDIVLDKFQYIIARRG